VRLAELLDRCEALEERAAALYRGFAAVRRDDSELAKLWTALAADEDAHAHSIRTARSQLTSRDGILTTIDACETALADVGQRLRHAEGFGSDATPDRQLAAALDLELSELEALRRLALQASQQRDGLPLDQSHVHRLAHTAMQRSRDGRVRLAAALLLARERLATDASARR
jgi:rubrerythrin